MRNNRLLAAKNPLSSIHPFNRLLTALLRSKTSTNPFPVALSLFSRLTRAEGIRPNACTYGIMINSCVQADNVKLAFGFLLRLLREDHKADGSVFNPLLWGLCRENQMNEAVRLVLDKMPELGVVPDVTTYNILVKEFCSCEETGLALQLILKMVKHGCESEPDLVTYNTVIDSFCKKGMVDKAEKLLMLMLRRGVTPNLDTYISIMKGYFGIGRYKEVIRVSDELVTRGFYPK